MLTLTSSVDHTLWVIHLQRLTAHPVPTLPNIWCQWQHHQQTIPCGSSPVARLPWWGFHSVPRPQCRPWQLWAWPSLGRRGRQCWAQWWHTERLSRRSPHSWLLGHRPVEERQKRENSVIQNNSSLVWYSAKSEVMMLPPPLPHPPTPWSGDLCVSYHLICILLYTTSQISLQKCIKTLQHSDSDSICNWHI